MNIDNLKKVIQEANPAMSINRPIRLADVLITYEKQNHKDDFGNTIFLSILDNGMLGGGAYNWEEIPVFWDLKKDFDNQSDECKKLLIMLLVE